MAYLGLVPSKGSSSASVGRSGLTKAGSSRDRQMLFEAAWWVLFGR
jgi:transposase